MLIRQIGAVLLLAGMVAACGNSTPSNTQIIQALNDKLKSEGSADYMKVDSIHLVNGYQKPEGGYVARLKTKVVLTKSCKEVKDPTNLPKELVAAAMMVAIVGGECWPAGYSFESDEKDVLLQRGENGWMVADK